MSEYSENKLIEQPTIDLFAELGWQTQTCYAELCGPANPLGRETRHDVVLTTRLRTALTKLNPNLPTIPIGKSRIVPS
jgi:type I restriction enzyme R subunit